MNSIANAHTLCALAMEAHVRHAAMPKRATNISLSAELVEEARELNINISQACESGLAARVAELRAAAWLAENGHCIESSNDYVEKHGLPLAKYRQF